MASNNPPFQLSIRTKLLLIYMVVILTIFGVSIMSFPKMLLSWMLQRSEKDLITTRQVIQETIEGAEIQHQAYLRDKLDAVARAKEIEIWICMVPQPNNDGSFYIPVIRLGSNSEQTDLQLSMKSAAIIENIRNGYVTDTYFTNLFPEYYPDNTLTMAYATNYIENRFYSPAFSGSQTQFEMNVSQTAVIFLNMNLQGFTDDIQFIMLVVSVSFGIITVLAGIFIWILAGRLVTPVNQMREIASMISKGDFSKTVDVTSSDEIGDLAHAFNTMVQELQEVEQNREAFIANVSHDFRSPLTSIRGYIQAMLDDVIPAERYPKYLRIVYDETQRLTNLTNDLLLLSKMQSGQDVLNCSRFDINEMIVGLSLGFEQRIEQKKLEMKFNFIQDKLFVQADPDRIERVICNLIDNAIKFTNEGDVISIETSIINRKAFISIADTGIGMSEETMRHIFERFHKGDKSRGLNKSGMGLGLAIVKQIILNHGEEIEVHSKEGEGTRFEFTLPLSQQVNLVSKD